MANMGYLGDGWCDVTGGYNSGACGWDGGDCCEETCDPDAEYQCGLYGYECQDPDYGGGGEGSGITSQHLQL